MPQDTGAPPPDENNERLRPQKLSGRAASPATPPDSGMSVSGYLSNMLHSVGKVLREVLIKSPMKAVEATQELASSHNLKVLAQNPMVIGKGAWQTTKDLGRMLVSPFTNVYGLLAGDIKPKEYFYDDPLNPIIDFTAGSTLLGGTLKKTARMGYAAGAVPARQAVKLIKVGRMLESLPGRTLKVATELPQRAVGINPAVKYLATRIARHESAVYQELKSKYKAEISEKIDSLSTREKMLFDDAVESGVTGSTLAANPKVAEAFRFWEKFLNYREKLLGYGDEGYRLLSNEAQVQAVLKKFAARKGISVESAQAELSKLLENPDYIPPRYKPAVFEKDVSIKDISSLPDEIRVGEVGFLNPYRGGRGITDPSVWVRRAVDEFTDLQMRLRIKDRFAAEGLLKPAAAGEVPRNQIVSEGLHKKYLNDPTRAQGLAREQLVKQHGWEKTAKLLESDPATQKYIASLKHIVATDPYVASYLRWNDVRIGGALGKFFKVYDKIVSPLKGAVTVFNPAYYSGQIVGDAMLAVLSEEWGLPWDVTKGILEKLPPELRKGGHYTAMETGATAMGAGEWLSKVAQNADDFVRRKIWSQHVATQFKKAAASLSKSKVSLDDFVEAIGSAESKMVDTQLAISRLDQSIMARVPNIRKITSVIDRLERRLVREGERAAARADKVTGRLSEELSSRVERAREAVTRIQERIAGAERASGGQQTYKRMQALKAKVDEASVDIQRLREMSNALKSHSKKIVTSKEFEWMSHISDFEGRALFPQFFEGRLKGSSRNIASVADDIDRAIAPFEKHVSRRLNELKKLQEAAPKVAERQALLDAQQELAKAEALAKKSDVGSFPVASDMAYSQLVDKIELYKEMRAQLVGEVRARMIQGGALDAQLPQLRQYAEYSRNAIDHANTFLGEYHALGPIERQILWRIFPFYSWVKSINKLAFSVPFIMPKSNLLWHRFAALQLSLMDDPKLPHYMAGYAPVAVKANGQSVWAGIPGLSPANSVGEARIFNIPIPKGAAFWQQNPFISLLYRGAGGRDEYYWAPPPAPGEVVVSVGDGSTYTVNERGEFEKTTTQPGLVKNLAHMFPQVQFVHQLLSDYDVRKGPALKPDGTPRYPFDLLQTIAKMVGVRVMYKTREEAIRAEKIQSSVLLKELIKQYRKTNDPDTREYIKSIFNDIKARHQLPRISSR